MISPRFLILTGVTGVHLAALAMIIFTVPAEIAPPVAFPVVQGILVSTSAETAPEPPKQSVPPAPAPRPEPVAAPQPVPKPALQPLPAPLPVPKAAPSERAISAPETPVAQERAPEVKVAAVAGTASSDIPVQAQSRPQPESAGAKPAMAAPGASGPLTLPRVDAGHLSNPAPVYPSVSRRLREQGQVLLDVLILADGTVGEARLKASSRYPRLDNAALDAVRRWRYQPARRGNTAIAYWYVQPMVFSLQN